jgi:hypothetical protein
MDPRVMPAGDGLTSATSMRSAACSWGQFRSSSPCAPAAGMVVPHGYCVIDVAA